MPRGLVNTGNLCFMNSILQVTIQLVQQLQLECDLRRLAHLFLAHCYKRFCDNVAHRPTLHSQNVAGELAVCHLATMMGIAWYLTHQEYRRGVVLRPMLMQALMGGKDFCGFLQQLQAASPALSAPELPTLHALSALAAEFQPVTTSAESSGLHTPPLTESCSCI